MTKANVLPTLVELQREYAEVVNEVAEKQRDLSALESRCERLGNAIESLKRLAEPDDVASTDTTPDSDVKDVEDETAAGVDDVVPDGRLVPADSSIAKYIKRGGEGRRLSSTFMVRDVVNELDKAVTRDVLKNAFFQKFSREEMSLFWERPDNAFGTALNRAVQDDLIVRGKRKSGAEIFGSKALAERIRQKTQQAASSETEAEED